MRAVDVACSDTDHHPLRLHAQLAGLPDEYRQLYVELRQKGSPWQAAVEQVALAYQVEVPAATRNRFAELKRTSGLPWSQLWRQAREGA